MFGHIVMFDSIVINWRQQTPWAKARNVKVKTRKCNIKKKEQKQQQKSIKFLYYDYNYRTTTTTEHNLTQLVPCCDEVGKYERQCWMRQSSAERMQWLGGGTLGVVEYSLLPLKQNISREKHKNLLHEQSANQQQKWSFNFFELQTGKETSFYSLLVVLFCFQEVTFSIIFAKLRAFSMKCVESFVHWTSFC